MALSTLQKLLFGAAFFLPIAVCSGTDVPKGDYPDHAQGTRTTVTVHVVWLPDIAAVNRVCYYIERQLPPKDGVVVGCYEYGTSTIYVVQPRNFNDAFYLEILGHEFWHALGAEHPVL